MATCSVKVCAFIDAKTGKSCPNLADPGTSRCPAHPSRPANARWSKDRDGAAQHHFRKAVLARDGNRCTRCGSTWKLVAHHIKPGYDPSCGTTLCGRCHGILDKNAR